MLKRDVLSTVLTGSAWWWWQGVKIVGHIISVHFLLL